jgi:muconate cycloisomerase
VEHAGSRRGFSDVIVPAVQLGDGAIGHGETVPRLHVTGETPASVVEDLRDSLAPVVAGFRPESFPQALDAIESLPWRNRHGRLMPAARAAMELALLDAYTRHFGRGVDDIVQWMGLPGFGTPGSLHKVRYGGMLATRSPRAVMRETRVMYYWGLRDFKLQVGMPGDRDWFGRVARYLRRPMAGGRVTLRIDANGAWNYEQAEAWLERADFVPLSAVEQPLPRGQERHLVRLRDRLDAPLVHDESLVTLEDARRLLDMKVADGFNIRIGKCGGLLPSLRIAALARREDVILQLGWSLGETSILAAAGVRFLQVVPGVLWADGCGGRNLLGGDITRHPVRFRYGGRPPDLPPEGLGVHVDVAQLNALCSEPPVKMNL